MIRRTAPKRLPASRKSVQRTPSPLVSSDEKRELILAHHAARQANKPHAGWGIGYYIGISASCLVILTGWWMTIGTNIRTGLPGHDEAAQIIQTNLKSVQQRLGEDQDGIRAKEEIKMNLEKVKQEYQAAQAKELTVKNQTTTSTQTK